MEKSIEVKLPFYWCSVTFVSIRNGCFFFSFQLLAVVNVFFSFIFAFFLLVLCSVLCLLQCEFICFGCWLVQPRARSIYVFSIYLRLQCYNFSQCARHNFAHLRPAISIIMFVFVVVSVAAAAPASATVISAYLLARWYFTSWFLINLNMLFIHRIAIQNPITVHTNLNDEHWTEHQYSHRSNKHKHKHKLIYLQIEKRERERMRKEKWSEEEGKRRIHEPSFQANHFAMRKFIYSCVCLFAQIIHPFSKQIQQPIRFI